MFGNILNWIVDQSYQLYDRFGKWWLLAAGSLLVLSFVLVMYLCGMLFGSGDASGNALAAQSQQDGNVDPDCGRPEPAAQKAVQAKQDAPLPSVVAAKPAEPAESVAKTAVPPPKPARPEKLADWKKEDYLAARREGDPRLTEAIDQLAGRFKGSDPAARLLVGLLQTAPVGNARPGLTPGSRDSTTAIADALVANGSTTARESLAGLLGGSIQVPNDRGVVTATLRALAGRAEPADEDLLLATAVDKSPRSNSVSLATSISLATGGDDDLPSVPVSGASAAMSATELQKAAAAVIQATASENLRIRLVKRILQPNLSADDRTRLIECLKEQRPENLVAQSLLFVGTELEPDVLEKFQQYFAQASGAALAKLAGIPQVANSLHPPDVDPARVARVLWTQPFCEALNQRLAQVHRLSDSRGLVMLAATIPLPATRDALQRTLERHWYESPASLWGTAWPQSFLPDPGLLFVLKSLPNRRNTTNISNSTSGKGGRSGKGAPLRTAPQHRDVREKQDQISLAWLQTSGIMIRATIERLHAAALTRKIDRSRLAEEAADTPVSFDRQAEIVAAIGVDLPGATQATANLPSEPLRIRYVRAEKKSTASLVVAQYRRQLKNCEQRTVPYGVWFDGYQTDPESSRKVSLDVVIRKAVPNAPVPANQEQYLVIEMLSVETVPDPSQSQNAQVVPDPAEPTQHPPGS